MKQQMELSAASDPLNQALVTGLSEWNAQMSGTAQNTIRNERIIEEMWQGRHSQNRIDKLSIQFKWDFKHSRHGFNEIWKISTAKTL
jgi:hypothetical protein